MHRSNDVVTGRVVTGLVTMLLMGGGCGVDEAAVMEPADVQAAWEQVTASGSGPVAVRWSEQAAVPEMVYGPVFAPLGQVSEAGARRFLADRAELLGMADGADLALRHAPESLLGRHYTFQQEYRGVPVYGASVALHVAHDGQVLALHNSHVSGLDLTSVRPSLPAEDAVAIARAEVAVLGEALQEAEAPVSELVVLPSDEPVLAYRVVLEGMGATYQMFIDAGSGELVGEVRDINRYVAGSAQVYNVNAIVATHDNSLTDQNDSAAAVPPSAYMIVTLQGLDGTGYLDGEFASSADTMKRTFSASENYIYDRSTVGFNEAMGYYFIDYAERYIQSLGFLNINNRRQVFSVNRYKQDNSYYSPSTTKITLGTGGVDDAEDAEVILHEYGHSIQDNQVPGFGSSAQGGAMGEGFGDYWAASVGAQFSGGFQDDCVAEWDAVSYSSSNPPCLRRMDGTKHYPEDYAGEVHRDGEMWSAALWQIRAALGAVKTDTVVLQSHFLVPSNGTFADGANALVSAAQGLGYSAAEVDTIRTILQNRGFAVSL